MNWINKALCRGLIIVIGLVLVTTTTAQQLEKVTEIEGISEYRLDNGAKVLLFPDESKPQFTLNMTVLVGSRHEGYGETGMAHLLEHMLFRGTDRHPDIPKLLKDRGVLNMNGTTSIDRTNYFETLPATEDNLEFAIALEADRLINSWIKPEHLLAEMTIVRSEFERGENNPAAIMIQRIMRAAYQWHNYGNSTIGNRTDIMRVPASNLRVFYRKFYQPDNITLVLAGKFDKDKALELFQEHFGSIPKPTRELPSTYTEEPPQDGERFAILRRSGDVQFVGLGYHIPSASNQAYAASQVLASILSNVPTGPLYKSLVETKIATSAGAFARVGHDPGLLIAVAQVPKENNLEEAKDILIEQIEKIGETGVSETDVKRAVLGLIKSRERSFANTESFATQLSEWESYGDWRLYFLHRDRIEKVTPADVQAVAKAYLMQSNRTVGLFYPTDDAARATVSANPKLDTLLADYKGREKMAAGEAFEPSPENIASRTQIGNLESGLKYALLPKETRGDRVTLQANLHYGTEDSLKGKTVAAEILPSLMTRGTQQLGFQEFRDRLDELKASLSIGGSTGNITVSISTERDNLLAAMDLMKQALREPKLDEKEFEIIRKQLVTQAESGLSEPMELARIEFGRHLDPREKDDVRYTPTAEENVQRYKSVSMDDVRNLYENFLNGQHGEVAVVGDFDPEPIQEKLNSVFADWKSEEPYQRIAEPANTEVKGERITIKTPDKANAVYIAGLTAPYRDDHPDYEAMLIGNYIMGGGPLSSRIADRVRKKDGLSYTAMTQFNADSQDERSLYLMFCISNPTNTEKVVSTVAEEVDRMLASGVTMDELNNAKESFLTNRKGGRANDGRLARILLGNLETGRTMEFHQNSDEKIEALSKERVDAALKRLIDPKRLVIVTAGDFDKAEKENAAGSNNSDK